MEVSGFFRLLKKLILAKIIVGTPGRLMDFMQSRVFDFSKTSYVVLDEADRMLDMGFEPQMRQILSCIRVCVRKKYHMIFCSKN